MSPYISAIIAALGACFVGWLAYLVNKGRLRQDAGNARIDQYQEDLAAMRLERTEDRRVSAEQRSGDLERTARLERITRLQGDYIEDLRQHIAKNQGPPPPPYPPGLIT